MYAVGFSIFSAPRASRSSLNMNYSPPRDDRVLGRRTTVSLACRVMKALSAAWESGSIVGMDSTPCTGEGLTGSIPARRRLLVLPPIVSCEWTYGCGRAVKVVIGAEMEAESVSSVGVGCASVCGRVTGGLTASSAASAAAMRRLRRMGFSMDVLTIHSCRAVRLRMRDRSSTSEASAESPQADFGRT